MIKTTLWLPSLEEGKAHARNAGKDILIDIFDPSSDGCNFMRATTYNDTRVESFIDSNFVGVRLDSLVDPILCLRFHSVWTPCIILQDVNDQEYRRSYGVLSAEQFLAEFSLAHGLRLLHSGQYNIAIEVLESAIKYTGVDPLRNAENHYWLGVAKFLATKDKEELEYEWQKLRVEHPSSDWARKTDYYQF